MALSMVMVKVVSVEPTADTHLALMEGKTLYAIKDDQDTVQPYGFIVDYRPIEYIQKYIDEANHMIVGLPEELTDDDWIVWEFAGDVIVEEY